MFDGRSHSPSPLEATLTYKMLEGHLSPAPADVNRAHASPVPPERHASLNRISNGPTSPGRASENHASPAPPERHASLGRLSNTSTSPGRAPGNHTPPGMEGHASSSPSEPHDSVHTSHQSIQSQPQSKLRRASKVLTSRKSLDSGSRWLYPYFQAQIGHVTDYSAQLAQFAGPGAPEVLGALENVVYSSPDSGMHDDDLSLSSSSDDTSSRGENHH
jgi:hypothetical protein